MKVTDISDFADVIVTKFSAVYTSAPYRSYSEKPPKLFDSGAYPHWIMYIKLAGDTWYHKDGRKMYASPNHVMLIAPGVRYKYEIIEPGPVGVLMFDLDVQGDDVYCFPTSNSQKIITIFKDILRAQGDVLGNIKCIKGVYRIFEILLESHFRSKRLGAGDCGKITAIAEYMDQNLSDSSVTNASLAAMCGMSESHFRRLFSSGYGMPPMTYLRKNRMEAAKNIIIDEGCDSVEKLAARVGYKDVYHFSKMFKKYTGLTPKQFKRNKTEVLTWDMIVMKDL